MARQSTPAGGDSFRDLAKQVEILEREMATQREAIERLKAMGRAPASGATRSTAAAAGE